MKTQLRLAISVCALAFGLSAAETQTPSGAATCSQQAKFALSGCQPDRRMCRYNIQDSFTECMKSGIWTNFSTGAKYTLQKQ
jgi:hypothetical protein